MYNENELNNLKEKLGYSCLNDNAKAWWGILESRPAIALAVLKELEKREATIYQLFLAHGMSDSDNIQAVIDFYDLTREISNKADAELVIEDFEATKSEIAKRKIEFN